MTDGNMNLLVERERTHGDFRRTGKLAQDLKARIRQEDHRLTHTQLEAIDMICSKIARAVCGNPNEPDHYRDISGYALLALRSIEQ